MLFKTRKPRQFNYLPTYYNPKKEEREKLEKKRISFSDDKLSASMYERSGRIPFSDIKKAGRQRFLITSIIFVVLFIVLLSVFEKIEPFLRSIPNE